MRVGCWACTLVRRDRAWPALEGAGLLPRGSVARLRGWLRLWLHMARVEPEKYREKGGRYGYAKLKREARVQLLESLLEASKGDAEEVLKPIRARMVEALKALKPSSEA